VKTPGVGTTTLGSYCTRFCGLPLKAPPQPALVAPPMAYAALNHPCMKVLGQHLDVAPWCDAYVKISAGSVGFSEKCG
jgi:hypothetical protein